MKTWQEDVTSLFEAAGIQVRKPVLASFGEATYEYDANPKANWLYYAFLAFLKLALTIQEPELVVTVGVGSALDGIALYETLRPKRLKLIDVNPAVLEVARANLRSYFSNVHAQVKWSVVLGNLCSPLQPESADLIYANVPTIPGDPAQIFDQMNSSSFFDPAWAKNCPIHLVENFLALQYEFLCQTQAALKPAGSALIALGVRMPALTVDVLFQAAGFRGYEPIVLDLKEQSQPAAVVTSYAEQERKSENEFDFYTHEAVLNRPNVELPLSAFKRALLPWRVSAREALELTRAGQKVLSRYRSAARNQAVSVLTGMLRRVNLLGQGSYLPTFSSPRYIASLKS